MASEKQIVSISFLVLLYGARCNKKIANDQVSYRDINGVVLNNCTDSGMAGVKVFLKASKENLLIEERSAMSADQGKFLFSNVEVHSNEEYQCRSAQQ